MHIPTRPAVGTDEEMLTIVFFEILPRRLAIFAGRHERARPIRPAAIGVGISMADLVGVITGEAVVVFRARLEAFEFGLKSPGRDVVEILTEFPVVFTHLEPLVVVEFAPIHADRTGAVFREQFTIQRRGGRGDIRCRLTLDLRIVLIRPDQLAITIDTQRSVMAAAVHIRQILPIR